MDMDRMNQEMEYLVERITSTLRGVDFNGNKVIDDIAVKALFILLESMKDFSQDKTEVNKRFVALLFYLYRKIRSEAEYTDYPEPIFILAGQVEDYMADLFGKYFD
ncbi:hypothetical protein [Paenibacillus harenae]|uniref:Uncharacterized protein n=1 Tax=Paenibacillus harenae TaxID=306543 RepID=A0ABT9U4Y5_PAEHA|nr:hypothetical protein [Paenibacillus harenae]MDQ0062441.1 hypothetical protein [Paenibacillus harenae]MDQ0114633.1 hypothetical protein [Paenibacillus harenae]